MISLEVRRTIVKSPPELWAELSDPARLARHLSELGDIRIVRTDPEQMVEWEAQDARGSVLIKPSGWGTKVTLTVLREMPEPEPPATSTTPAEPQTPAIQDAAAEQEPPAEQPDAQETAAEHELLWRSGASPEPEPPAGQETRPAEHELPFTPDAHEEPEPLDIPEASAEPESPEDPEATDREPELEPRRGFFARLFGRRRIKEARESDPPDSINPAEPTTETTMAPAPHQAAPGAGQPEVAPPARIGAPATEAGRRPGHNEPGFAALVSDAEMDAKQDEPGFAALVSDAEMDAKQDEPGFAALVSDAEMDAKQDEPGFAALVSDADMDAKQDEPGFAALESDADVDPKQDEAATAADQPAAVEAGERMRETPPAGVPDISAELRTAEEVAAEHVKAVLTSMLDRLGAAHHRPFSRA